VAYVSYESGAREVFVRELLPKAGTAAWQISTRGGRKPSWSADGRELFYIGPDSQLYPAAVHQTENTFSCGSPEPLFPLRLTGLEIGMEYQQARDGGRILGARSNACGLDTGYGTAPARTKLC
jgi:hypothetical protein